MPAHATARAAATLSRLASLRPAPSSCCPSSSSSCFSSSPPPFHPTTRPALRTPSISSATPSRGISTLGDAVVLAADGISFIHHAGLPWFLTIPLVALGVNVSLRLPVQYYTRGLVLKRNALTPLVKAWAARHAANTPATTTTTTTAPATTTTTTTRATASADPQRASQLWSLRVAGLTERSRRRIYKAWRVQRWKSLAPLLSMLPFVIVTESLRRLCGAPLGWLGRSVGLGAPASSTVAETSTTAAAELSSISTTTPLVETSQRLLDPCLADGGCLWFVDLTAADPVFALPLLCSALLARSSWGRLSREQLRALLTVQAGPRAPIARVQTALGRTLLLVPLFPVLFADLPSAIFLYWAASFALTEVNEVVLARALPKKEALLSSSSSSSPSTGPSSSSPGPTSSQRRRPAAPYLLGTQGMHKPGHDTEAR